MAGGSAVAVDGFHKFLHNSVSTLCTYTTREYMDFVKDIFQKESELAIYGRS